MTEPAKKATREAYGEALVELGAEQPSLVVLDADLAQATKTALFKKAFPERHFDCGIAEANMIGVAAGLSTMGLVPFVSSFAMFAAGRAYEQVRNTLGYPRCNVKIGATHAGISVGEDGASHQCCEDIALMRTIPGMTVICPADAAETRAAVRAAFFHEGPVYLRLGRLALPAVTDRPGYRFELGKGVTLRRGGDLTLVATGLMVAPALQAADMLAQQGIQARVLDIHTIKPLDTELLLQAARETGLLITAEEHSVIGGLGEAVCAAVAQECPVPVRRVGVQDVFGHSGPAAQLLQEFGLCAENIARTAQAALAQRR